MKIDRFVLRRTLMSNLDEERAKDQRTIEAASEGPWQVADSCSWRRIVNERTSSPVITPCIQRSDGHPDLHARREDLEFVARARKRWPEALAEIDRLTKICAILQETCNILQETCNEYELRLGADPAGYSKEDVQRVREAVLDDATCTDEARRQLINSNSTGESK
jgi:hypothetical protein